LYILLFYNLFNFLIKKSIKRFSFISYILILNNLDYGRNNVLGILLFFFFFFLGGRHKLYAWGRQIFKYGPELRDQLILLSLIYSCIHPTVKPHPNEEFHARFF
jgi:hypothetical protein